MSGGRYGILCSYGFREFVFKHHEMLVCNLKGISHPANPLSTLMLMKREIVRIRAANKRIYHLLEIR